jgi:hypothetical protein
MSVNLKILVVYPIRACYSDSIIYGVYVQPLNFKFVLYIINHGSILEKIKRDVYIFHPKSHFFSFLFPPFMLAKIKFHSIYLKLILYFM